MFHIDRNRQLEKYYLFFALFSIFIWVSPYFILGEDAHIRVHDNLDSNLAWYKVLEESGQIFGPIDANIPQIINGELSRNAYGTEFSGIVLLHKLFSPMLAYALSLTITRVFAFLGMYLLLRKHFLKDEKWAILSIGAALTFALTPVWPSGMLSTLGMPLALWALLNIRNGGKSRWNWITLTLLPLYSSLVLGFFFFLSAMGLFWLVDLIRGKVNWRFLLTIVYMTFVYLGVEYRLVGSMLLGSEATSRDEYFHARLSLWRVIRLTFKNYLLGHTHVNTVHTLVIVPITFIGLYLVMIKKLWRHEKTFIFFMVFNFSLSLWYAFWFYKGWLPLTETFHILDTFNFARYHFLRPIVIYVLFGLSLKIIWENGRIWRQIAIIAIVAQIAVLIPFNEEIYYRKQPSFKQFFAVEQFTEIQQYIGQPIESYRVASIGIHPAIAQYNGFYTLDTYNNFYPLTYKHSFRKIIAKELEKNKKIKEYFDEWGGRCYIFTAELGKHYMFKKSSKKTLKNLELNIDHFKKMGGKYIFSAIPIENAKENRLKLEKLFTSKESAWNIYLYHVLEGTT